jgi:hypothetical protein
VLQQTSFLGIADVHNIPVSYIHFCLRARSVEFTRANFDYPPGISDRLCGLVVRVPGYRSRGPGLIPIDIRFSEK